MWKIAEPLILGLVFITIISQVIVPIFDPNMKYWWFFKKKPKPSKYEDTIKQVSEIKIKVDEIIDETHKDFEAAKKKKDEAEKLL